MGNQTFKKIFLHGEWWVVSGEFWVLSFEFWVLSFEFWVLSGEFWVMRFVDALWQQNAKVFIYSLNKYLSIPKHIKTPNIPLKTQNSKLQTQRAGSLARPLLSIHACVPQQNQLKTYFSQFDPNRIARMSGRPTFLWNEKRPGFAASRFN